MIHGSRLGCLIGALSGLFLSLNAQNLVPNPDFEAYHNCPPYPGQIQQTVAWDTPNNNSTDYYHRCAEPDHGASVPVNDLGEQIPASGNAYTGIRIWIPIIPGNPVYREYLAAPLLAPLEAGTVYEVKFKVSLAETSSHATDGLGLYFSTLPFINERLYAVNPQIQNPAGNILKNQTEWTTISGTYRAEGGEQYILIGNFQEDAVMTRILVDEQDAPKVYYYVDDVEVTPCAVPADLSSSLDTAFCMGTSLLLSGIPQAKGYIWNNQQNGSTQSIAQAGAYSVVNQLVCYDFTQYFSVKTTDCACRVSLPNPQLIAATALHGHIRILPNEQIVLQTLEIFDFAGRFLVLLQGAPQIDSAVLDLPAGMYFYQVEFQCVDTLGHAMSGKQSGKLVLVR
jgi:hypothetical protein